MDPNQKPIVLQGQPVPTYPAQNTPVYPTQPIIDTPYIAQPVISPALQPVPQVMPQYQDASQAIPQAIPQPMYQISPSMMPQDASQAIPQAIPQTMPQTMYQASPAMVPQDGTPVIPQVMPQAIPQGIPQGIPQDGTQPIPQAIPQVATEITVQPIPQEGTQQTSQDGTQTPQNDFHQVVNTEHIRKLIGLGKCLHGLAIFEIVAYCISLVGIIFIFFPIIAMKAISTFDCSKMKIYLIWKTVLFILSILSFFDIFSMDFLSACSYIIGLIFQVCGSTYF